MREMKPCPFCGGKEISINERKTTRFGVNKNYEKVISTITTEFQVHCRNCACGTYYALYESDAIEAWNRRA